MSLPKFPDKNKLLTLEQAISAVITSVAMEEMALSRLITAESEKIQYVIDCAKTKGCDCTNLADILAVNNSVDAMIKTITKLQEILKEKLAIAVKHLPKPPHPPYPPRPPCPPEPQCVSIIGTERQYTWNPDISLFLMEEKKCNNGVRLIRRKCESLIILPRNKEVEICFELEATSFKSCPSLIEFEFRNGNSVVKREQLSVKSVNHLVKVSHKINYKTPISDMENAMVIKLVSPNKLTCVGAKVLVKVKNR